MSGRVALKRARAYWQAFEKAFEATIASLDLRPCARAAALYAALAARQSSVNQGANYFWRLFGLEAIKRLYRVTTPHSTALRSKNCSTADASDSVSLQCASITASNSAAKSRESVYSFHARHDLL